MDDSGIFLHSIEAVRLQVDRRLAELIPSPKPPTMRCSRRANASVRS